MTYRTEIAPAARRRLKKLPRPTQRRIVRALSSLAEEPRPPGVKRLSAGRELYRIRVGSYRVVYTIDGERLVVLVVRIGDRKEVYRRLFEL